MHVPGHARVLLKALEGKERGGGVVPHQAAGGWPCPELRVLVFKTLEL